MAFTYAPLLNSAARNDGALTDSGGVRYQVRIPDPGANTIVTEFVLGVMDWEYLLLTARKRV